MKTLVENAIELARLKQLINEEVSKGLNMDLEKVNSIKSEINLIIN